MNSQGSLAAVLGSFGLMADIYDFGIVNLVRPVLEEEFGTMTPSQDGLLTSSALTGAIIGQLCFGAAADYIGRRCLFITTATLVGVASLGTACAGPAMGLSIYSILTIWRFFMGLGIGGEYPLSAATTAENNDPSKSSCALACVFSGMAIGQLLAPAVVMLLAGPLAVPHTLLWRYAFGFGALLALVVALVRYLVLEETRAWVQASSGHQSSNDSRITASPQAPQTQLFRDKVSALWAMKWSVTATMGAWLIYDVVTYGTSLYSTTIFPAEPGLGSALVVFYINALTLPGYGGALYFASFTKMKHMQLYGLLTMTVCFCILALYSDQAHRAGITYLSIFAFQRCVDAMGPGVATFTVPGQIFPTRIRATAHGISAAAGKLGAVIGTVIFPILYTAAGLQAVMAFMAFVSAIAALFTQLFTPLYGESTLEEIAALDPALGVAQQAAQAEALLFSFSSTKGESTSLMPEPGKIGPPAYGNDRI